MRLALSLLGGVAGSGSPPVTDAWDTSGDLTQWQTSGALSNWQLSGA